jgi:hypothetical protein
MPWRSISRVASAKTTSSPIPGVVISAMTLQASSAACAA